MTRRELEEYRSLRTTIGRRGNVRTGAFLAGLSAWALAAVATAFTAIPVVTMVPLLLLAGAFEAVFSLHVAVERIGRYLQVFHEDKWEETAMVFGAPLAGTRTDPLFTAVFSLAALFNFIPVLVADPVPIELAVLGAAHALFGVRLVVASRAAGRQRVADLARFQQIRQSNRST